MQLPLQGSRERDTAGTGTVSHLPKESVRPQTFGSQDSGYSVGVRASVDLDRRPQSSEQRFEI